MLSDLQRARAKVPHGSYRGDSFADMGSVLTKHLRAKYGEAVKECVDADVADLRKLQNLALRTCRSAAHSRVL